MLQLIKSKLFWLGITSIFAIPTLYNLLPVRIDFTIDKSLPYSIWLTKDFNQEEHKYAMFKPITHNAYTLNVKYLLKKIGCKEGDTLLTVGSDFYCNELLIAIAKPTDKNGNIVEQFTFSGQIPKNKYFMIGTHPNSYDSRYFGFVDKSQIERGATPWFKE